jgi:hypothetical protein
LPNLYRIVVFKKNALQKQGNIFRRNVMIYGFIELDACGLLDRIGFGLGFSGFSFGLGLDVVFRLDWIWFCLD